MMASPTVPLTFDVDLEAARAYETARPEDRERIQLFLNRQLHQLVAPGPADPQAIPAESPPDVPVEQAVLSNDGPPRVESAFSNRPEQGSDQPAWDRDAWREALCQAAGIWKDRDDLPSFAELRAEWDRF